MLGENSLFITHVFDIEGRDSIFVPFSPIIFKLLEDLLVPRGCIILFGRVAFFLKGGGGHDF